MGAVIICVVCARTIGKSTGDCACRSPVPPPRPSDPSPYRSAPRSSDCPRCGLRLSSLDGSPALECGSCLGLFLDRETVQALERAPEGAQQLGFPKHARRPEPAPSGYLKCPVCSQLMNRTVFMRSSKVIVDVCRTDGVWFDAGEVQAVVEFLERGGAEAAREQARSERETEREKLRSQRIREIEARAGTAASRRELERSPIMSLFKLF